MKCRRAQHYYACDKYSPTNYEYYILPIKFAVCERIITRFCTRKFNRKENLNYFNHYKFKAQTALFKDPVRTAL